MTIKELRVEKNMTQNDVAKAVGVSMMTYQLWERGSMKPSADNAKKLKETIGEYTD